MTNVYLKEAIETLVSEVLGKFNLAYFKRLAAEHDREPEETVQTDSYGTKRKIYVHDLPQSMSPGDYFPEVRYAQQMLPIIGDGSSRITFALSGGKVLKIAKNEAGIAQNQEEISFFEKSGRNEIFTKIYEADKDFKWIIAELVKPLDTQNIGQTMTDLVGMSTSSFENIAMELKYKDVMSSITSEINRINEIIQDYDEPPSHYQKQLESLKNILKDSDKLQTFYNLKKAIASGMSTNDIHNANIGRTMDGKIKILDYGYSNEIGKKYY